MKTVTIRDVRHRWPETEDVRHRWPETEKALAREGEILITRDAKPVAKLVRIESEGDDRARFDPAAHEAWQRRVAGGKVTKWVDADLAADRAERPRNRR